MLNFYLATRESYTQLGVPYFWCSAKTYYQEQGIKRDVWNWGDPWMFSSNSVDQILDLIKTNPPNVFGFSLYIWNEFFMDSLAKKVKELYPECVIIYGGPQCDIKYSENFFREKSWVDVVVPSDAYGEIIVKEILDNYPIKDYSIIPYIYYTDEQKNKYISQTGIDKKNFQWPSNIFKAQEEFILPVLAKDPYWISIIETSRGCPYKCIYCDWGGGTYTKINKKPFTLVLDELEWLIKNGVYYLAFVDANFGIMSIDVEITKELVNLKKKYDARLHIVSTENAKNHIKRTLEIKSILAANNLLNHYKVSIQTINEEVQKNIERIDPPIQEQIAGVKYLKENFQDLPVRVETILGLPGETYQTICDQIDLLISNDLPAAKSGVWMLLPEAPAFSPDMRKRFKIKTIKKIMDTWPFNLKAGFSPDPGVTYTQGWDSNINTESVIGTYSYSPDEWIRMFLLNILSVAGDASGITTKLIKYIRSVHGAKGSQVYDKILNKFVLDKGFNDNNLNNLFQKLYSSIHNWVFGENRITAIDYKEDFPLLMSGYNYAAFIILTNTQIFYKEICEMLAIEYNDNKIVDLGKFISGGLIDYDYNPDNSRTFATKYDWLNYFNNNLDLSPGLYEFKINDQYIHNNINKIRPNWHTYNNEIDRLKTFFYQALGDLQTDNFSKTIQLTTDNNYYKITETSSN
jgi:putative methyltransferase